MLTGLPFRPATAWAALRQVETDSQLAGSLPAARFDDLLSDPGWLVVSASLPVPPDTIDRALVAERDWWRAGTPRGVRALDRLARWCEGVAWALNRSSDLARSRAAQLGWLAPLGLWAIAALDLDLLADWLDRGPAERRLWERQVLSQQLGWLGRGLGESWGLPSVVCEATALFGGLPQTSSNDAELAAWKQAISWVESTPLAISGHARGGSCPDPLSVKKWMAEFQASASPGFLAHAPAEREAILMRTILRQSVRQPVGPIVAEPLEVVAGAVARVPPLAGWRAGAARLEQALTGLAGIEAARILRYNADGEPQPAGAPATWVVELPDQRKPEFTLSVWAAGDRPDPLIAEPVLELIRGWSRWTGEIERLRELVPDTHPTHNGLVDRSDQAAETALGLAQFAAGAGHELNNPLAVIMGRAQLLLGRLDEGDSQRSLRVIIAQCQRAHRMLRDLMYYAQPTAARPRVCIPEEVVRRSLDDLRPEAESREISVRLTCGSGPRETASLDPDQLRLAIDALVRNAFEASKPADTVEVRVRRAGKWLSLEVLDEGAGLRADEAHQLLNPLYCGRQAGRGLGLGLSRLARMLDQGGGTLHWSARATGGMRFQARWPLGSAPAAPP